MKTGKTRTYSIFILLSFMLIVTAALSAQNSDFEANRESKIFVPSQTYIAHPTIQVDGDEEFLTAAADNGWPGTGTPEDPIIIEGYSFFATLVQPVRIWNTDLHWVFRNNYLTTDGIICGLWPTGTTAGLVENNIFDTCHSGIYIELVEDLIIRNNTMFGNTGNGVEGGGSVSDVLIEDNEFFDLGRDGIVILDPTNVTVRNNSFHDLNFIGVDLKTEGNNLIQDNVFRNVRTAIKLGRSSSNNEISGNTIIGSAYVGVNCYGDSTTITDNLFRNIGEVGIRFASSLEETPDGNSVTENTLINCTEYGIELHEGGVGNTISANDFFENGDTCHICDNATDTVINGNFYDTWSAPDADEDSVVDSPYSIAGSASNSDTAPVASPIHDIPEDYVYTPQDPQPIDDGNLPLMELVLVAGIGLVVCVVAVIFIKKR